jgi:phosphopantetheine--protein transferase-like protein
VAVADVLEPCIVPLVPLRWHRPAGGWAFAEYRPTPGVQLFLGPKAAIPAVSRDKQSHLLLRHALSVRYRSTPPHAWRFARSGLGQLLIEDAGGAPVPRFSLGATDGMIAVALSDAQAVGVDLETMPRVALNASHCDNWLSPAERAAMNGITGSQLVAELACRWTLKEAIGKAAGVGLALPLGSLTIARSHSGPVAIAMGRSASLVAHRSLKLFGTGDLIVGLAHGPANGNMPTIDHASERQQPDRRDDPPAADAAAGHHDCPDPRRRPLHGRLVHAEARHVLGRHHEPTRNPARGGFRVVAYP